MLTKEKIELYINFFNDNNQSFYSFSNGYIEYHKTVDMFIKDCYDSNIIDSEYLITLEDDIQQNREFKDLINIADKAKLKALLTFYIRGERFNEGMIKTAIDTKIFVDILKNLI